ncbi:MAG: hypothetical protein LBM73_03585, partial [Candidatus Nomurabacteria bacterium]|nr:hypothetical protein [Candidatus Nomurabacteria bacterium]
MDFQTPLSAVKGVGAKTAEKLAAAGFLTAADLINFVPRAYDDFSNVVKIADLTPGKRTIRARCEQISTRFVRRGMRITTAVLADDSGRVQAVWFNQPYREKQLAVKKNNSKNGRGVETVVSPVNPAEKTSSSAILQNTGSAVNYFYFSGRFDFARGRYQLTSPSVEIVDRPAVNSARVLPVYPARAGLKPNLTRKILTELKPLMLLAPETLPEEIIEKEKLLSRGQALLNLHFPENIDMTEKARRRLAFEELFQLILAAKLNRSANQKLRAPRIEFNQPRIAEFVRKLPFQLTDAQRRALWEILQDFEKSGSEAAGEWAADKDEKTKNGAVPNVAPMNRLLQGDVGSGKTVVAGAAAYQAFLGGYQTALMAPT